MIRNADAEWKGDLKGGSGTVTLGSGSYSGPYSFLSRFDDGSGTNPEELLGAAHAGCFSMALANTLAMAGHVPTSIHTTAKVHAGKDESGFKISRIDLVTRGVVPGLSAEEFVRVAEEMKTGCIVSRALSAVPMTLDAQLLPG